MKKILILTAGSGDGEDVATTYLRDSINGLATDQTDVEIIDLVDSCYGRFHDLLRQTTLPSASDQPKIWKGFRRLLGPKNWSKGQVASVARLGSLLRDALLRAQPEVVVITSPIYGFLIDELHQDGRQREFTLISVVTEGVLEDSPWAQIPCDFFAVTNEHAGQALVDAGVPGEKIKVVGFPLEQASDFLANTPVDTAREERKRILYLMNGVGKKAPKVLSRLLENPEWHVTVGVARDTDLDEMARSIAVNATDRVEVVDQSRRLPELLARHDLVIACADNSLVQQAIAACCPVIAPNFGAEPEQGQFALLREVNAGVLAEKPKDVVEWIERAFRDEGRLLSLWRKNLESLRRPDGAVNLAHFILEQSDELTGPVLRALPSPQTDGETEIALKNAPARLRRMPKKLLLCDLHTHTTWSDGRLTVPEIVDFYGQRGFDCLSITDHLCDPKRLLGKLVNLTGLVIPPDEIGAYFEEIEREKKRAWAKYDLLLMTGVEFNKDGYTPKTSTHLLGVDLKEPINPSLDIKQLITEIQAQGGLAIASHPHEIKSEWGKNTLYLWEHVDEYAPLIDAWEVANRDDIFNPISLKKLPFIANSDFHKPKHIHSWKTMLYCEKEAEAIKHCIRVNRDVSISLYRDHRFGLEERNLPMPALRSEPDLVEFEGPKLAAKRS